VIPLVRGFVRAFVLASLVAACGGSGAHAESAPSSATTATPPRLEPATAPAPAPVEPWPSTKPGAAWTVITWTMDHREALAALEEAKLPSTPRTDEKTGRVEAIDVTGAVNGWKASITFDATTGKVDAITVRGDPVSIESAHAERARLRERFGDPREAHVHWSKQCAGKGVDVEGGASSWRSTRIFSRPSADAKGLVEIAALSLSWGLSLADTKAAATAAGFVPEKLPPPPAPPPPPKGKGKPPPKAPKPKPKPAAKPKPPPPGTPKPEKIVELPFKKGDEHVMLSVGEKSGLQRVAIGTDAPDRATADRRANDALTTLGACDSEAETDTSAFADATADVKLSITGFQGQRVVVVVYRAPKI
jgi:hypothetical protein